MKYGNAILAWLPLAVAITGICGLVYVTVQQNYRQSLNDPQIQMAEDAAASLADKSHKPIDVVPIGESVDITTSLKPWIAVYDENGKPIKSSGVYEGRVPQPPQGVFDALKPGSPCGGKVICIKDNMVPVETHVTWQPDPGTRVALVVNHYASEYVVAGRNMSEVEEREGQLSSTIILAWALIISATLVLQLIFASLRR